MESADKLDELYARQLDFMEQLCVPKMPKERHKSPESNRKLDDFLTKDTLPIAFALLDEVHEFVRELNWKPWKKTKKDVDLGRVHEELTDCWFFLLELSAIWGLDAIKLMETYRQKMAVNQKRQKEGY